MGSIPPAASIEYPQREIFEVISRANSRGYTDFSNAACAAPADTDLQQLRKAIEGFVRSLQFSDLIDAPTTFTVHGTGATFADLNAAMEYLSKYKITHNGFVTLQLGGAVSGTATRYNYNQMIFFDHPNNDRIGVIGATMLAPVPTTASSYAMNGNSAPTRAADTTTNLTMLRTKFATELHFTSGCGVEVSGASNLAFFDAILITGDGSNGPISDAQLYAVAAGGSSSVGYPSSGAGGTTSAGFPLPVQGIGNGLACVGGNYGFTCIGAGGTNFGTFGPLVAIGNLANGIIVNTPGVINPVAKLITLANTGDGAVASLGGLSCNNGIISNCNAGNGVTVTTNGIFSCTVAGSQIYKNAGAGMFSDLGRAICAGIDFGGGGGNANGNNAVVAGHGAMLALSGTCTNVTPTSPAMNTIGNNNSLITNS